MKTILSINILCLFIMINVAGAQPHPDAWYQDGYPPLTTGGALSSGAALTNIGAFSHGYGGAYAATAENPIAPFNNPASLDLPNYVYLESGFLSDAIYDHSYFGDSESQSSLRIPTAASVNYQLEFGNVALSYIHYYHQDRETEDQIIVHDGQGNPTGEIITVESQENINDRIFLSTFSTSINENFSLGVSLGLHSLTHEWNNKEFTDSYEVDVASDNSATGFALIIGGIYDLTPNLRLGVSGKYFSELNYEMELENGYTNEFETQFPPSLQLGVDYDLSEKTTLKSMVDYQMWSIPNEKRDDQLQFHAGVLHSLLKNLDLGAGFFTQFESIILYEKEDNYFDQLFITGGIRWKVLDTSSVDLSVMDSHLFGNDSDFHQTYLSLGVSYNY